MTTNLSGHWKGTVTYGPSYEDLENKELYFSFDIKQDNDTFTGIGLDTGGVGSNPDKAIIKGFIEGKEISFIKQYDSVTWEDENGKVVEIEKPGPEINYWGTFNPLTNIVEGHWEIYTDTQKFGDGWFEDVWAGTWTMQKD